MGIKKLTKKQKELRNGLSDPYYLYCKICRVEFTPFHGFKTDKGNHDYVYKTIFRVGDIFESGNKKYIRAIKNYMCDRHIKEYEDRAEKEKK